MNYDASLFDESVFDTSTLSELTAGFDLLDGTVGEQATCVLAAGDLSDVHELRDWCAKLPTASYGQVFIEVFSPIQIQLIPAPAGVNITWICREQLRESTLPGIGIPRGQALASAVDAWLSEWYSAEPGVDRHFTMWMGARGNEIMHDFWRRLEHKVAQRLGNAPS